MRKRGVSVSEFSKLLFFVLESKTRRCCVGARMEGGGVEL